MTWFRRLRSDLHSEEARDGAGSDPSDSPDALRAKIFELIAFVNRSAGRLPGEAVVIARRITDTVREVVDGADPERGLDIYAVVSIKGILDDYLPTALQRYLALDPATVDVPRPSGHTPSDSLLEQLDALWSSATDVLVAAQAHDADSLLAHGSFLRTKFTGSDLDLQSMAEMKRGANVALTREVPGLTGLVLGMAWNAGAETALADNLVSAALLCDRNNRALSERHFVFFNQLSSPDLSVTDLDRAVGEDQDQLEIDLNAVPAEVERIVAVLYVNDGPAQKRTLGQLKSCVVRVLNLADNKELVRSEDLAPALRTETAVVLGEVYRHEGGWKFKVLGQGYSRGIAGVLADYGLSV